MSHLAYRPEIDGLRAVAVLAVVLYHAGINALDGGFVGVDVFFVISGYLIAALIVKDVRAGTFSFADFWERRARRILPALFVMVTAVLAVASILYMPTDLTSVGRQAMAQAVFSSNILFYTMEGYFAPGRETLPLLHTWSLAVEEQYYLLFPLLLVLLLRRWKKSVIAMLAVFAVLSLTASIWAVSSAPNAAFYLLPFRAWELLLGALLALHAKGPPSERVREVADWGGLALILASATLYDKTLPFPGALAIPPCAGAALFIWSNMGSQTRAGRVLSARPLVFIGKISYSWYLWHWPIFMMVQYYPPVEMEGAVRYAALTASLILAVLSWRYVETPFRQKSFGTRRAVFALTFAGIVAVSLAGFTLVQSKGFPDRLHPSARAYDAGHHDTNPLRYDCLKTAAEDFETNRICQTNEASGKSPSFFIWGDSFADAGMPGFAAVSQAEGVNGYISYMHACPPILGHSRSDFPDRGKCLAYNDAVFAFIKARGIKKVFLVANWNGWLKRETYSFRDVSGLDLEAFKTNAKAGVQATIDALNRSGADVYMVLAPPAMSFDAPRMLAFQAQFGLEDRAFEKRKTVRKQRAEYTDVFAAYNSQNEKFHLIDPLQAFCDDTVCRAGRDGFALYYDHNHVTTRGAALWAETFAPYLRAR